MMAQLLSSPTFWNKLAEVDSSPPTSEQNSVVLREFVTQLKIAGLSDGQIYGIVLGAAEGFAKIADNETAPATPPAVTPPAATKPVTPPVDPVAPAPAVSAFKGIKAPGLLPGLPSLAPSARNVDILKGLANPGEQALLAVSPLVSAAKNLMPDSVKATYDTPALVRTINDTGDKEHPMMSSIVDQFFDKNKPLDQDQKAEMYKNFHEGHYLDAAKQFGEKFMANDTVKSISNYAVPALATIAASRLAGAGWGGSLAAGAGAGYAYGNNVGGLKDWMNTPSAPPVTPPPTTTAAPSPQQKEAPAAGAGPATGAEKTKKDTVAHANSIRIPTSNFA
jgi:hypothetical protein